MNYNSAHKRPNGNCEKDKIHQLIGDKTIQSEEKECIVIMMR